MYVKEYKFQRIEKENLIYELKKKDCIEISLHSSQNFYHQEPKQKNVSQNMGKKELLYTVVRNVN
jgi:hypothetical protein